MGSDAHPRVLARDVDVKKARTVDFRSHENGSNFLPFARGAGPDRAAEILWSGGVEIPVQRLRKARGFPPDFVARGGLILRKSLRKTCREPEEKRRKDCRKPAECKFNDWKTYTASSVCMW